MPIDSKAIISFVERVGNKSKLIREIEKSARINNHPKISRVGLYKLLKRFSNNDIPSCEVGYIDMFHSVAQKLGFNGITFYKKPEIEIEIEFQI